MKVGEANARLKQMEVALDEATLSKQRVETEAALAKQQAEESIAEIKRIRSTVSIEVITFLWLAIIFMTTRTQLT